MSDQDYFSYDDEQMFGQLNFGTPGLTGPSFLDAPSPPQITAPTLSPAQLAVQERITNQRTLTVDAYRAWESLPPKERIPPNSKVIAGYAGKRKAKKISKADVGAFVTMHGIADIPEMITRAQECVRVEWPKWRPENHAVPSHLSSEQLEVQACINRKKIVTVDAYKAWVSLSPGQRVRPTAAVVAGYAGLGEAKPNLGIIRAFKEEHGITDEPYPIRTNGSHITEVQWPKWHPENHAAPSNLSAEQSAVRKIIEVRNSGGGEAYSAWLSLPPEQRIKPNRRVIAECAGKKMNDITATDIEAFRLAHGIMDDFRVIRNAGRVSDVQWLKWDPANHIVPTNLSAEQSSAAVEDCSSGVSPDLLPPSGDFPPVQDPWYVAEGAEAVTMGTVASPTPYTYGNALPIGGDLTYFSHDFLGNDVPNQVFNPGFAAYAAPDVYYHPGQEQHSSIMQTAETAHYPAPSGVSDFAYFNMDCNVSVSAWAMPSGYGYNAGAPASRSAQNTSSILPAARGHDASQPGPNKRGRGR